MTAILVSVSACHGLLDVSDPTLIRSQDVANSSGANGRRVVAYSTFHGGIARIARNVGLFSDELSFDELLRFGINNDESYLDSRNSQGFESIHLSDDPHLALLDFVVTYSSLAIPEIRQYTPSPLKGDFLAQLFAYRGIVITQMAEDICPGFPINDITPTQEVIYSAPFTNDSAAALAVIQFDSALADVQDSTVYAMVARVGKGRALLDLGKYDEAAAAVAGVPDTFAYKMDPSYGNALYNLNDGNDPTWRFRGYPIGDYEAGTGLGFVSENDTIRIPRKFIRKGFNDTTILEYGERKYSSSAPIMIVSGTEARLIEAEAALHNNDTRWLTVLNALRTPVGLPALTDPGTVDGRVDLVYHERAFWLYLTGRRLGDMRRLIRNYGLSAASLFPAANNPFIPIASYQNTTAIPFSFANAAEFNPHITSGCTTR